MDDLKAEEISNASFVYDWTIGISGDYQKMCLIFTKMADDGATIKQAWVLDAEDALELAEGIINAGLEIDAHRGRVC